MRLSTLLPRTPRKAPDQGESAERRRAAEAAEDAALAESLRRDALVRARIPARFAEPRQAARGRELWAEMRERGAWCLYLWGGVGRGKTDLACAVALAAMAEGVRARFAGDADMLAEVRAAIDDPTDTEAACVRRFAGVGLLVVDDLGKTRPTQWGLEKLWQVVDGRYREGLPTVVTSQLDRASLGRFLARTSADTALPVASRLADGLTVRLDGPDRRLP